MTARRRAPRTPEQRQAQWTRSLIPGSLGGAVANAAPIIGGLSTQQARARSTGAAFSGGVTLFARDRFTLAGATDAVNLTYLPSANSQHVYLNGQHLDEPLDYVLTSRTVTLASPAGAIAGDIVDVRYAYNSDVPAAVAEEFQPVSTGEFWLEADQLVGGASASTTPADGGQVAYWSTGDADGLDATLRLSTSWATYRATGGPNGKPAIDFTSNATGEDGLGVTTTGTGNLVYFLTVVKMDTDSWGGNYGGAIRVRSQGPVIAWTDFGTNTLAPGMGTNATWARNGTAVALVNPGYGLRYDDTPSNVWHIIESYYPSGGGVDSSSRVVHFGGSANAASIPGRLYAVVGLKAVPTTARRQEILNYFSAKTGIAVATL